MTHLRYLLRKGYLNQRRLSAKEADKKILMDIKGFYKTDAGGLTRS